MKVNLRIQIKYVIPLVLGLILGLRIMFELPFTFIIDYELYFLAVIIGIEINLLTFIAFPILTSPTITKLPSHQNLLKMFRVIFSWTNVFFFGQTVE